MLMQSFLSQQLEDMQEIISTFFIKDYDPLPYKEKEVKILRTIHSLLKEVKFF